MKDERNKRERKVKRQKNVKNIYRNCRKKERELDEIWRDKWETKTK